MIDETGQRILRLIDVHKDQIIAFADGYCSASGTWI